MPVYSNSTRTLIFDMLFAPVRVKGMSAPAGQEYPRILTAPGELCPPPKPFLAPALDAGHSQDRAERGERTRPEHSTTVKGEDG